MTAQPMRPEDVPHELIEAFERAALMSILHEDVRPSRYILAAVIPAIRAQVADGIEAATEARVRAQIAAQIEAVFVLARRDQSPAEAKADAYRTAAAIARGDQ